MHDFIRKLINSKTTIIILLWTAAVAYTYNLDYVAKKVINPTTTKGRTVEEIMATPAGGQTEPAWDNNFKSAIELRE